MKPMNRAIVPLQASTPATEWTISGAKSAIQEHDAGRFHDSALLADSMGGDPQISGHLGTRVRALAARSGLPFTIEPGTGARRRADAVARQVEALWWDALPEAAIGAVLRDSIMLGVAVAQIEWIESKSASGAVQRLPRLRPLPAYGLEFQEWEQKWIYQTVNGPIEVTPNDGSWFLHLPQGELSWRHAAVRALWIPYLARVFCTRDWLRHAEVHAMPALAIKEPAFASDEVETQIGTFYQQFRNFGRETVLRLPQGSGDNADGWDAKWLELMSAGWESYQALLRRCDSDASMALLGRDVETTDKAVGGDSASAIERVRTEYLSADAEPLTTALREQVWMHWGRFNVPNWSDDLAPWGKWNTRPPVDLSRRASMLNTAADAIAKLLPLGANQNALLDEFQIPRGGLTLNPPSGDEQDVDVSGL